MALSWILERITAKSETSLFRQRRSAGALRTALTMRTMRLVTSKVAPVSVIAETKMLNGSIFLFVGLISGIIESAWIDSKACEEGWSLGTEKAADRTRMAFIILGSTYTESEVAIDRITFHLVRQTT
jgi:hypothetical protein